MITEAEELKDTVLWWLPPIRRTGFIMYWVGVVLFLAGIISLFFIHVDLAVRARGIIRPLMERTEIRSPVSGLIDSVFFREGDTVLKNSILLTLRDPALIEKKQMNENEIVQCGDFIHDLVLLSSSSVISPGLIALLNSPLYKQETRRFNSRMHEQQVILSKAKHERMLNEKLAMEKVIAPKEFYDIRMQELKMISACQTFHQEQLAVWQTDLVKYKAALKQCLTRREELDQLIEANRIRATVSGYLQEFNGKYPGNAILAGEQICAVSPGGALIGECYVSTKDIGLLNTGQLARLQVDAFNYNYFGALSANIYAIDNDFTLLDKTPVFKVKCRLHERILKLSNGYAGELKKGMGFQVRFITANRSLWQLLYDGLDDLLNPARQPININH